MVRVVAVGWLLGTGRRCSRNNGGSTVWCTPGNLCAALRSSLSGWRHVASWRGVSSARAGPRCASAESRRLRAGRASENSRADDMATLQACTSLNSRCKAVSAPGATAVVSILDSPSCRQLATSAELSTSSGTQSSGEGPSLSPAAAPAPALLLPLPAQRLSLVLFGGCWQESPALGFGTSAPGTSFPSLS